MTKAVVERAAQVEITHHLGYEVGDPGGVVAAIPVMVIQRKPCRPRTARSTSTCRGTLEPVIVPKKARRLNNINSVVLWLYSRGMTTRDIEAHLEEVYGTRVSRELISNITEVVVEEIKEWQARGLDEGQFLAIVANQ
jgi:putative transposase